MKITKIVWCKNRQIGLEKISFEIKKITIEKIKMLLKKNETPTFSKLKTSIFTTGNYKIKRVIIWERKVCCWLIWVLRIVLT